METILFVVIAILLMVAGILYFFLNRALNVNDRQAELILTLTNQNVDAEDANAKLEAWFEEFKSRLIYSYQRIKAIDASGHFVADDEVGYFFTELKGLIERLYELGIVDETEKQEIQEAPKLTTEELQNILAKRKSATVSSIKEENR